MKQHALDAIYGRSSVYGTHCKKRVQVRQVYRRLGMVSRKYGFHVNAINKSKSNGG